MPSIEGSGGVTPLNPLASSEVNAPEGKHKGSSVKAVDGQKHIPSRKSSNKALKKLKNFKITSLSPSAKKHSTKPPITTQPSHPTEQKPKTSAEDHSKLVSSRLVDREATDLQIKRARKQQPWKDLEKVANPTKKKQISKKGFGRLMDTLQKKDISHNRDLKLMVMFAAHKFDTKQLSADQMNQYMGVLVEKYVLARAHEQVNASALTLAPTGSTRTGFGGEPLKASESVQLAELMVTASDRLSSANAEDKDSGVVHNFKRDFPLDLYGWSGIDFEDMSQSVDATLLKLFPEKLHQASIRDSGSSGAAARVTPEFEQLLVEGVSRSLDEYADSLLKGADSRVSSPIYKDASVKQSEHKIKEKVEKRKEQLVATLQQQLGGGVAESAKRLSTDAMVGHKIDLWVRTKEQSEASAVTSKLDQKAVVSEEPEEGLHRGSMLDDISKELAAKARDRVQAQKEGKDPDVLKAAAELLTKAPPVPPKPNRKPASPPAPSESNTTETSSVAQKATGEVDHTNQARVTDTIRKFEDISNLGKTRK